MGSRRTALRIPNSELHRDEMVSLTPRPLCPLPGERDPVPSGNISNGPQDKSGRGRKQINLFPLAGIDCTQCEIVFRMRYVPLQGYSRIKYIKEKINM
jgi:hypothetical protein